MNREDFKMMSKPLIDELFKVMKAKRLSVSETAKLLNIGRRELQRWHSGKHYPKSKLRIYLLAQMIDDLRGKRETKLRFEWGKNKRKLTKAALIKEYRRMTPKLEIR